MNKIAASYAIGFSACIAAILFGVHFAFATDFSSSNFTVKDPVVESGASFATSSSFQLWSSFGQVAIGTSSESTFGLRGGFLYFPGVSAPSPSPSPSPTPTPSPTPSGTGLGSYLPSPPFATSSFATSTFPGIIGGIIGILPPSPPCASRRSDYNCDGRVNLRDLSIFLSFGRRAITPRNLSLVFSDWTDRLLKLTDAQRPSPSPPKPILETRTGGLAQVGTVLEPRSSTSTERVGIFKRIGGWIGRFFRGIQRIFGR